MNGIRLLIPRSAVHRICRVVVGLLIAGCVLIGCAALAGCSTPESREHEALMDRLPLEICAEAGGAPRFNPSYGSPKYLGCDFSPTCPPCPCEAPAEAPEGGRP